MTRGLINNNPGNIRIDGVKWHGEVIPSRDSAFKQFEGMSWGYRAMFVTLNTYQKKYGLRTIRQMVGRWAPPVENDTDAYVAAVARWSTVDADCRVTATNRDVMVPIVAAMSRVENGRAAVMSDVEAGWELFIKGIR
jgi:hypothetical protein